MTPERRADALRSVQPDLRHSTGDTPGSLADLGGRFGRVTLPISVVIAFILSRPSVE
jgi:hypothetical protein